MNVFWRSERPRYNGNRTLDLQESVITFTVPEARSVYVSSGIWFTN